MERVIDIGTDMADIIAPNANSIGPDHSKCQARRSGSPQYDYCLEANPIGCKRALSFGSSYLCLHPQRHEIVARTEAEKARKRGPANSQK